MTNVRGLIAWIRMAMNHRYGHLVAMLHVVLGALALGAWHVIDGPLWAGVFWLAFAALWTPRLARVRGRLFAL